jgi:hypothetical protein
MAELDALIADIPQQVERANRLCQETRRSGAWVKVKLTQQQEFITGGYTKKALATLYGGLQKIKRTSCFFINLPEKKTRALGPRHRESAKFKDIDV